MEATAEAMVDTAPVADMAATVEATVVAMEDTVPVVVTVEATVEAMVAMVGDMVDTTTHRTVTNRMTTLLTATLPHDHHLMDTFVRRQRLFGKLFGRSGKSDRSYNLLCDRLSVQADAATAAKWAVDVATARWEVARWAEVSAASTKARILY